MGKGLRNADHVSCDRSFGDDGDAAASKVSKCEHPGVARGREKRRLETTTGVRLRIDKRSR